MLLTRPPHARCAREEDCSSFFFFDYFLEINKEVEVLMKFKPSSNNNPHNVFYPGYVFRITAGNTPFVPGSWSKNSTIPRLGPSDTLYFSPAIYTWVKHVFTNKDDKLYAIQRPKSLTPDTMCCGINSHYHFCVTKHPELLSKLENAIRTKNYNDPALKKMFQEHEQRVQARFGKKLSAMKGGEYMGTLGEFDSNHPVDSYPELILKIGMFSSCKWEELVYKGDDKFIGKKSKKLFKIEQTIY